MSDSGDQSQVVEQADQPVLEHWIGRTHTGTDTISAVQVRQMAATMDDAKRLASPAHAPLPAGWHWLYFNPIEVQSRLGEDGHPARGEFLPPVALPRRMWAGSRLEWTRAFNVGAEVHKTSEILKVSRKSGRTGEMVLVTVAHVYSDAEGVLLREEQDIVYRGSQPAGEKAALADLASRIPQWQAAAPVFERTGENTKAVTTDPVMLYRYSAATFNGHRIHYDLDYCRDVEGYPALVVHGPLIATLLLGYVENDVAPGRRIKSFEFRATRPTFDLGGFHLHAAHKDGDANALNVWATNNVGEVGVDGHITLC
jgi:3-methylfumaryl-CoA hydratase